MDILTFVPSWFLSTTLVITFPLIFLYAIRWTRSSMGGHKLPPGPPRLPVIGNLHQVFGKGEMHHVLWDLSRKYGPAMLLHFGSQPYLIISSSEMARQVLKTHDSVMCSRPESKGAKRITFNYMDVAFSPNSDHYKDMRKFMVSEIMGARRIRLLKNEIENEIEGLIHSLSLQPLNTKIDLGDTLSSIVNNVVCKVTFGKSYDKTFNGKTLKEISDECLALLSGSVSDYFPTFGWIIDELIGWNRRLEKCFTDLDGALQMVIDEHLERNATKASDDETDLVDDCLSRLTIDETKALLMNVLNGAIESTTITVVWVMSELVKNPRIMEKLQNEIRSCIGRKTKIHDSDIAKMTYLKMVMKETLRFHSPAPFSLPRECVSHCQVGGYDVFPGTKVLINVWAIGKDPQIWKERPSEFWPERFENIEVDFFGKLCEMVPFGGGRRACPGYNLDLSTIELVVAKLVYLFDWKIGDGVKNQDLDMEEEGVFLLGRKTPLCLIPIRHNWQSE